ncbi:sensor histidine kinase [Pseudolysinimonas sp.]|uniref:sensor histidine kinase n=1 Tax=Pseudolysinimonas sp. TaxID=2680009 RepID=UPI003F7CFBB9
MGWQITLAATILVAGVVVAAFAFVLDHIEPARLLSHREATIDIGGLDLIEAAVVIGAIAVILAAVLSRFATRRAVRPLGDALRSQRAFVANASHELRTPLAVLDARLQKLQRGLPEGDPSATVVVELRRDTATLVRIVNDLLDAAEQGPVAADPVPLVPTVALAVESLRLLAADRGIEISLTSTGDPVVEMPSATVHRCVVALVDNALKFSSDGSLVEVDVHVEGAAAVLSVRDHGPGIRGIDPAAVFERFARGTEAGARPGFGIGLALVRDGVERAGGSVAVAETGPDGTRIVVRLPRADGRRRRRRS